MCRYCGTGCGVLIGVKGGKGVAIKGDPNVEGLPEWKPYTPENGICFIFDHNCSVRANFDRPLQGILNDCCFRQLDDFRRRPRVE